MLVANVLKYCHKIVSTYQKKNLRGNKMQALRVDVEQFGGDIIGQYFSFGCQSVHLKVLFHPAFQAHVWNQRLEMVSIGWADLIEFFGVYAPSSSEPGHDVLIVLLSRGNDFHFGRDVAFLDGLDV